MKINLITKHKINKYIIREEYNYIKQSKIINNQIYAVNKYNISVYDLNSKLIKNININALYVFNNKNKIYFLIYNVNYYIYDENNKKHILIKFNCKKCKIDNKFGFMILKLNFDIQNLKI